MTTADYSDLILKCLKDKMSEKSVADDVKHGVTQSSESIERKISHSPDQQSSTEDSCQDTDKIGCPSVPPKTEPCPTTADSSRSVSPSASPPEGGDEPFPSFSTDQSTKMKQERTCSPESDTPRCGSTSAGAVTETPFGVNGTPDPSELVKQQFSAMLQGLPFLFPDMQRMVAHGTGLNPETIRAAAAAAAAAAGSSGVPSGGVQCACGVKFANRSNMEAHKKFYCSLLAPSNSSGVDASDSPRPESLDGEEAWGLHRCPQCPFTTTHKLSLNGHMNIHTTSPEEPAQGGSSKLKSPTSGSDNARVPDRYCADCDIQFTSLKTYRVHKAHYCQTRHVLKSVKSPAREEPPPTATPALPGTPAHGQPILLLPTDPVLLVPYSVLVGASLLPSHILPQQNAAVLMPDGQIQPLSLAHATANNNQKPVTPSLSSPNLTQTVSTFPSLTTNSSSSSPQVSPKLSSGSSESQSSSKPIKEETNSANSEATGNKRGRDGDCPLDLTIKRSKLSIKTDLLGDEEKENREVNTPSLSNSPAATVTRNGDSSSGSAAGEFEGKLLQSPARASPASEAEDRSTPRSPRPGSAAPNLASPRSVRQDSPRASTSVANKSPGQTSPTVPQTVLPPPLASGFPNILAGLDGMNSLQFTNLQYLQAISPEILLKMFNGILPPLTSPHSSTMKQGEARCNECNITFYKEENYLVHKKHYCAARGKSSDDDRASTSRSSPPPGVSRASVSPPVRGVKSELPNASNVLSGKTKPGGQFVCTPCGIKFTSPDNLSAHQIYYCPKREGVATEEGVTKGMWRCPRCRVVMLETLQAAHQCASPGSSSSHGWKCPCCPMLSPTAAAAQKHLETHAGIKAFRCTICGYRGNTLRGMRTHIRMHFEKRTNDLQEENFIECILEDNDRRFRMNNSQDPRMGNLSSQQQALLENPALAAILSNSTKSLVEMSEPPLSCSICPYVTTNRQAFIKHLALVHKLGVELKKFLDSQSENSSSNEKPEQRENSGGSSSARNSPPMVDVKLEPEVKLEVTEPEEEVTLSSASQCKSPEEKDKTSRNDSSTSRSSCSPSEETNGPTPSTSVETNPPLHRCHDCNISFSYTDSFMAHKRYYCNRQQSNTPPETTVQ